MVSPLVRPCLWRYRWNTPPGSGNCFYMFELYSQSSSWTDMPSFSCIHLRVPFCEVDVSHLSCLWSEQRLKRTHSHSYSRILSTPDCIAPAQYDVVTCCVCQAQTHTSGVWSQRSSDLRPYRGGHTHSGQTPGCRDSHRRPLPIQPVCFLGAPWDGLWIHFFMILTCDCFYYIVGRWGPGTQETWNTCWLT